MNWQERSTFDHRYMDGDTIRARIFWGGNLWVCTIFPPEKHQQTTTEVELDDAKKWAEEKLK